MDTVTTKGTPVTLTPRAIRGPRGRSGVVEVTGPCRMVSRDWGECKGVTGISGYAAVGGKQQRVIISVPKAAYDAVLAEADALAARFDAEQAAAERADLTAAIATGSAFRVAEIATQYGGSLCWASRLPEERRAEFAEWFREIGMTRLPSSDEAKVEPQAIRQVVGKRPSDGEFPGCENKAWIITAEEWARIVKISNDLHEEKAKAQEAFAVAEAADLQRKIAGGYCFACESYCQGDCDDYTPDPEIKFRREFNHARREASHGVNND